MSRSLLAAVFCLLTLGGCKRQAYEGPTDYAVPDRTPAQLQTHLAERCAAAQAAEQALLLEFSASWCSDCRTLASMKKREPLASAMQQRVKLVEVNVGDFERHEELLELYDVDRIATWVVLRPTDCGLPIAEWPEVARRSVEPKSRRASARELAGWIEQNAAN